jgi:molecular chaperone GrpE
VSPEDPDNAYEQVTVTDKRRIDPQTGEVRQGVPGPAATVPPAGAPAPEAEDSGPGSADKVAELTADLQRVQADYANYRRRAQRDQQVSAERAKAGVVSELLGVLDDLDRARSHGDLESGPLRSVADKLVGVLASLGLSAFGAEGDDFDPALHEAVQHEGDGGHPVIGTVLRHGYKLGEQVLRHAMVAVVDTVPDEAEVKAGPAEMPDNAADAGEQNAESEPPGD